MLVKRCGMSFVESAKLLIVSGILAFYVNFVLLTSQVMFFNGLRIIFLIGNDELYCQVFLLLRTLSTFLRFNFGPFAFSSFHK